MGGKRKDYSLITCPEGVIKRYENHDTEDP